MASTRGPARYGSLPALPRDDVASPADDDAPVRTDAPLVNPDATFERLELDDTSWVDVARGWLADPDALFTTLRDQGTWQQNKLFRYERWVPEPRLGGRWPTDPETTAVRQELHRTLTDRYPVALDQGALVLYRDGNDSVAFHRDREMKWLDDTVIAIASLGATRPFLIRPRAGRYDDLDRPNQGATHDLRPAGGDLLVFGGRCQADWLHAVPKVEAPTRARISIQWRWSSRRGRPEEGGNFGDPRYFSS